MQNDHRKCPLQIDLKFHIIWKLPGDINLLYIFISIKKVSRFHTVLKEIALFFNKVLIIC